MKLLMQWDGNAVWKDDAGTGWGVIRYTQYGFGYNYNKKLEREAWLVGTCDKIWTNKHEPRMQVNGHDHEGLKVTAILDYNPVKEAINDPVTFFEKHGAGQKPYIRKKVDHKLKITLRPTENSAIARYKGGHVEIKLEDEKVLVRTDMSSMTFTDTGLKAEEIDAMLIEELAVVLA